MISTGFPVVIERGGKNEERLYLYNTSFLLGNDTVVIYKTDMPNIDDIIARHKARYFFPALFCRPGMNILDIPCGSGYGFEIFNTMNVHYTGRDKDPVTVEYCRNLYSKQGAKFTVADLVKPDISEDAFDVIACIEGIEHIGREHQANAIKAFHNGLKSGGVLAITTPEKGFTQTNSYHIGEMTRAEFKALLKSCFTEVHIFGCLDTLHNGSKTNCLYGVCKKT